MTSIRRLISIGAIITFSFILAQHAFAQVTVRGRLVRVGPVGAYPAINVAVSIGTGPPTVTGFDGMYYFYNVFPGSYPLNVWLGGPTPMQFPIYVHYPYTDIPQLQIP
jgi:hypothetical protein